MNIPTSTHAAGPAFVPSTPSGQASAWSFMFGKHGDKDFQEQYSSLIGITTAIIGNLLISVALNTQRYAHIKLNEQLSEKKRLLRRAERRKQADGEADGSRTNKARHGAEDNLRRIKKQSDASRDSRLSEDSDNDERQPLLGGYQTDEDSHPDVDEESQTDKKGEKLAQKSYLKSPYWWAGIVMMTIGEAGNFLAYGFAPASVVSPLGVVAIISNCIIAPFFMKEPFRLRDFIGVVISVAGAVTVVLSAQESNPKLGPHQIWKLITTWEFETYLGISSGLIIVLMWASNKYGQKSIFIDLGLVGLFGGYTALSTKGVASLLSYELFQTLTFPVTYLLLAILIATAVMQIKYVNRALQRFDATQVIPTQFVMFTLSVILGSAVLYRDFERTPGDDAGKFVGGCAMTFIGVILITSARDRPIDNGEDYDEDNEAISLQDGDQYEDDFGTVASRTSSSNQGVDISGHTLPARTRGSNASLPESLERNHWESGATTPHRRSVTDSAAYSYNDASPLDENPWSTDRQTVKPKSSFHRLIRPLASLFPNQSVQDARYSAPDLSANIEASAVPRTPRHNSTEDNPGNYLQPPYHGTAPPGRHSLDIYPAPFTSPLSSSLSAVVADSLRRGVNLRRLRPRGSARPRLPGMLPASHTRQRGNSEPDNEAHIAAVGEGLDAAAEFEPQNSFASRRHVRGESVDNPPRHDASGGRHRSLSFRFGDLLRRARSGNQQQGLGEAGGDDDSPA